MGRQQPLQRFGADQRSVPVGHEHRAVAPEFRRHAAERVAGAERSPLHDTDGGIAKHVPDLRVPFRDHDDGRAADRDADGIDHRKDQWAATNRVQHLREGAAHPLALPRGEDHRAGTVTHVPASIRARLNPPGTGLVR